MAPTVSNAVIGVVYILFAVVPATIIILPWQYRDRPGAVPLIVAGIGAVAATVFHGVGLLVADLSVPDTVGLAMDGAFFLALNVAALGALYVAVEYTGERWFSQRRVVAALAGIGLFFPTARFLAVDLANPVAGLLVAGDYGFRVIVSLAALGYFLGQFLDSRGVYRKQSALLFVGFGIATVLGIVDIAMDEQMFALSPIGVSVGAGVIAWALFQYELLETTPIARETLFEHVTDPVVAFDEAGYVVDYNDAATDTFGFGSDVVGASSKAVFGINGRLSEKYRDILDGPREISAVVEGQYSHFDPDHPAIAAIRDGDQPQTGESPVGVLCRGDVRYFRLTTSTVALTPELSGHLLVFRDVTRETQRERDLDVLKQVLTRILRHNLRNDATMIKGYAEIIADTSTGETQAWAEQILETTDDLVTTSEQARRIEDVIDADGPVSQSLAAAVDDALDPIRDRYPDASYDVSVPDDIVVSANPELPLAIEATLENAVEHTDRPNPQVTVTADRDGPWAVLRIADNGPGIPDSELRSLEQYGETPLVHGSGAGLWLTRIAVAESNGDVRYDTDDGTVVRLRLPRAE